MSLIDKPLVSAKMITYNHAPYIAQAIEGVLQQETNFPFELVIGEDCSTDGTREIVFDYQKKYPDVIRVITSEKNVGVHKNSMRTFKVCRGKYIALCEGDDYWTDPNKLQMQVDFLESHKDYVICVHNCMRIYEDCTKKPHPRSDLTNIQKEELTIDDFIKGYFYPPGHTSSAVFRNGLIKTLPEWYYRSVSGDLPFFILIAEHGKGKFFNKMMSVHRKHKGGVTNFKSHMGIALYSNRIEMYNSINEHFKFRYKDIIKPIIARFYLLIARIYAQDKGKKLLLFKAITASVVNDRSVLLEAFSIIIISSKFYRLLRRSLAVIKNEGVRAFLVKIKCRIFRKSMSEDDT